jgi:hypothetical protein
LPCVAEDRTQAPAPAERKSARHLPKTVQRRPLVRKVTISSLRSDRQRTSRGRSARARDEDRPPFLA